MVLCIVSDEIVAWRPFLRLPPPVGLSRTRARSASRWTLCTLEYWHDNALKTLHTPNGSQA